MDAVRNALHVLTQDASGQQIAHLNAAQQELGKIDEIVRGMSYERKTL